MDGDRKGDLMTEIQKKEIEAALQEFEDNAYHESLKPNISDKAKVIAMKALKDKLDCELILLTETDKTSIYRFIVGIASELKNMKHLRQLELEPTATAINKIEHEYILTLEHARNLLGIGDEE